ncbi:COG4639 Predicted kinase [uncultured Caudovirales phage]|uniref:COG4639 Predicted kinase n=1 Tax=uncultured Caudovirales phage TaxID=2100421 RepID=A0A6J5KXJ4_9CAUD|nr:COG4639 Predicted kinase [uncultured Caudovirales phage]CAB5208763.1 COG4639 Predicted kinase [uncultured Caudovirales phage]
MNKLYVLVGIPGSGKSTWVANQRWDWSKTAVVSTDGLVEDYAKSVGKTYSEVFDEYMPTAVKLMAEQVQEARDAGKDIVWDQTSTTVASRAKKFKMLPDYQAIAVVFKTPDDEELRRRLRSRPGKVIPQRVIYQMKEHWQTPTLEEGFAEIWNT